MADDASPQPEPGPAERVGARAPSGRLPRALSRAGRRLHVPMVAAAAAVVGAAVVAAFVATILVTGAAQAKSSARKGLASSISATVATATVQSAALSTQLSLPGTVGTTEGPASISPQTAGTVTSLSISAGQAVTAGQPVAELSDTQGARAKQAAAQAQLAQAQAVLATAQSPESQPSAVAQAQTQVASALLALQEAQAKLAADQAANAPASPDPPQTTPGSATSKTPPTTAAAKTTPTTVSPEQVTQDQAVVTDAQSQLAAAQQELSAVENPAPPSPSVVAADQAAVDAAQNNLDAADQAVAQLTVTALVSGTVAQVLVPVGGYAAPTTPIAVLAGETETLTAQASPMAVAALDGRLGAQATASLAVPSATAAVAATLSSIAPSASATTQQTAVTFVTRAALQPGAPVNIAVDLPQPKGPAVPSDAVIDGSDGKPGVFVVTGILDAASLGVRLPQSVPAGTEIGSATYTPVSTGVTSGDVTQILSGLHAGQTIVTTGQSDLSVGPAAERVAILPTGSSRSAPSSSPIVGSAASTAPTAGSVGSAASKGSRAARAGRAGVKVTVVSVHGNRLTVSTPLGNKTFTVPAGFPLTEHGKAIPLDQLQPGDVLEVTFTTTGGKLTPTSAVLQ